MKTSTKSNKALLAIAGWALLAASNGQAATFASLQTVTNKATALTSGGAVSMAVSIHKISDNSADTAINFGTVPIGKNWVLAQDYILLDSQVSLSGGGIQTYTDNTAADAGTFKFTGDKNAVTPAGLIDNTDTTKKLPTAWSIEHTTGTIPAVDPNANAGTSYSWFYHLDKAQVAIPPSVTPFANNDPYVTVQNTAGIHYASGPTQFGPNATGNPALTDTQNAIYVEANFHQAVGGRTYSTSTLRVEAYTD